MLKRIEELEKENVGLQEKLTILSQKLDMVDSYSQHFMSQSLMVISIVIAIAGLVIVGSAYFMVTSMINKKMDSEIEKRILKKLGEHPPVYFAKGEGYPNVKCEIILDSNIEGINDLEPKSLLILDAKTNKQTIQQLSEGFKYELSINAKGERVLTLGNYGFQENPEDNALITWAIVWIRKYSN